MEQRRSNGGFWVLVGVVVGSVIAIASSGGCSTIEGIGRDVRGMVEGMQHVADRNGGRVPSGR